MLTQEKTLPHNLAEISLSNSLEMPSTRSTKARSPVVKIEPLDVQETSSQSPMMFVPAVKKENEYFHEHQEDDEELFEEDLDDADNDEDYDDEDGNVDEKKNKKSKKIDLGIDNDGSAKSKAELSELEKRRLENIKRNEEYLKSMGFDSLQTFERKKTEESETKKKRTPRLKRNISDAGEDVEGGSSNLMEPVRRSRRLSKQPGEIEGEDNNDSQFIDLDGVVPSSSARKAAREQYILEIDPDADIGREKITAPMLHDYIESKQPEHLGLISNEVKFILVKVPIVFYVMR